ncbi:MAG: hypothetical protein ABGZ49_11845 [Akkermansiaceae bacterium]
MLSRRMRSGSVLLFAFWAAITSVASGAEKKGERVWTNADGRTLRGVLKERGDNWVKIQIKDRVHMIKLEKLSAKDRDYLKNLVKSLEVKVGVKSWLDKGLDLDMKTLKLDLKNVEKGKELYGLLVWVSVLKTGGGSSIKSKVESFYREDGTHKYEAGFLKHGVIGENYRGYALRLYDEEGRVVAERSSSSAVAKFLDKANPRYKPVPKSLAKPEESDKKDSREK